MADLKLIPGELPSRLPLTTWDNPDNLRQFMDALGVKLGYAKPEDWYGLTSPLLVREKAKRLLHWARGSIQYLLRRYLPDYDWKPWLFASVPQNHWDSDLNVREYMKWLADQLGIVRPEGWYNVTQEVFKNNRGGGMLSQRFKGSPYAAAKVYMPDYDWLPFRFSNPPHEHWENIAHQRVFADWLAQQLGCVRREDWYRIRYEDINKHGGGGMLRSRYDSSVFGFLKAVYPDYNWKPWRFRRGPQRYWSDDVYFQAYMEELREHLGYNDIEDWYNLTVRSVTQFHGRALMANCFGNSPIRLLRRYRPDVPWEPDRFQLSTRKTQRSIFRAAERWFGQGQVEWNFKHSAIRFPKSDYPMESDVYVPRHSLSIEYQGESHFFAIDVFGGQEVLNDVLARDEQKRTAFKANGIVLVEITYQWDRNIESLRKAIRDAFAASGQPVPEGL